jgi:hypothetical protein
VESDVTVVENLERQKQIRHYTRRLREIGADAQTINALTAQMLATTPDPGYTHQQTTQTPPALCEPQARRRLARGVLGSASAPRFRNIQL